MIVDWYSIFALLSTCACDLHVPTKFQLNQSIRRSYEVISISQDGGHGVANLIPAGLFNDGTRLIHLNQRLSYYYFRFPKTNGRHIGSFLPVCNLNTYITF